MYFREKHVIIFVGASTHTDLHIKGPAQLGVSKRMIRFKTLQDQKRLPKKSTARVSIEGHCVILLNYPRIKMFDFFF